MDDEVIDPVADRAVACREILLAFLHRRPWRSLQELDDAGLTRLDVERAYGGKFRPTYSREQELLAIDGVFHLLDGKGIMREHRGPLVKAIVECQDGRGETELFRFKCFKNGNLHLEFKRLDLVQELNLLAVGERVLGHDPE